MRTTALVFSAIVSASAALGLLTRWLDVQGVMPLLQALLPVSGWMAVLALLVVLALRAWKLGPFVAVPAVVALALAAPALIPHTVRPQPGDEVIMTSNMEFGAASASSIVAAVRAHHVQTLVLEEITPDGLSRLERAGLSRLLPHRVGATRTDFRGTLIVSAHRLSSQGAPTTGDGALMPVARVHAGGGGGLSPTRRAYLRSAAADRAQVACGPVRSAGMAGNAT